MSESDQLFHEVEEFIGECNALGEAIQAVIVDRNPQPSVAIWTLLTMACRIHDLYPPEGDPSNTIDETLKSVRATEEHTRDIRNAKDRDPNN